MTAGSVRDRSRQFVCNGLLTATWPLHGRLTTFFERLPPPVWLHRAAAIAHLRLHLYTGLAWHDLTYGPMRTMMQYQQRTKPAKEKTL